MRPWTWLALGLVGCAASSAPVSSTAAEPAAPSSAAEVEPSRVEAPEPPSEPAPSDDSEPAGEPTAPPAEPHEVAIRLELSQPVLPRGASDDDRRRLDAVVHVRNVGSRPITVEGRVPSSHQLEWRITAADGTVWRPTFLPPPIPRPGGPPRRSVDLAPGEEAPFCNLHGISGFQRDPEDWGPLPSGRYEVVVSGLRLGDARFAAPPVTLVVR